jgi:hypothetical protein
MEGDYAPKFLRSTLHPRPSALFLLSILLQLGKITYETYKSTETRVDRSSTLSSRRQCAMPRALPEKSSFI